MLFVRMKNNINWFRPIKKVQLWLRCLRTVECLAALAQPGVRVALDLASNDWDLLREYRFLDFEETLAYCPFSFLFAYDNNLHALC